MLRSIDSATEVTTEDGKQTEVIALSQFIADFGNGLLDAVREQNPPLFDGIAAPRNLGSGCEGP